jgi:hypothetical protein
MSVLGLLRAYSGTLRLAAGFATFCVNRRPQALHFLKGLKPSVAVLRCPLDVVLPEPHNVERPVMLCWRC